MKSTVNKTILHHLASNDDVLKDISSQISIPTINSTKNVFHDLMSCIIEQQIHYRSTKKIFQKIMNTASLDILTVKNFHILEKEGFKHIKLNTRKYETILRVVDFFQQNEISWLELEETEVRKTLSQIKGVGTWTIDIILLYTLEHSNIFPADDYHLRLIMSKLYDIDTSSRVKAQQKAIAENWSPYKSFGTRFLLEWKAFQKRNTPTKK